MRLSTRGRYAVMAMVEMAARESLNQGCVHGRPVTLGEIAQLKAAIKQIDPDAFVVVSSTIEVMNYRIGNQPHW